ncbi:NirD/YgiW/YdeI family stress tolerance protein [Acinetobacter sp. HR7]|uniref:NirD/YgiW/YdeI family stress tolerance protein n=1 Tax=Acinetobacter sp. HR7 TaxID=1509403 RepID=UPI0005374FFC|nr:NirD/YgiW/YdeI family stress tolerance protein [Acinetobacter sp. HR7]KGT46866.1 hypothetical protein GW12_20490 [Acinetobacter sp. HR7]
MKQMLLVVFLTSTMFATASWAGQREAAMLREAAQNTVSVAQAKQLADETAVTLSGVIVKRTKGDHFQFKDGSGTIEIDVDDEVWKPLRLKAGDQVNIVGEVNVQSGQAPIIDVEKLEKIPGKHQQWQWYNQH